MLTLLVEFGPMLGKNSYYWGPSMEYFGGVNLGVFSHRVACGPTIDQLVRGLGDGRDGHSQTAQFAAL